MKMQTARLQSDVLLPLARTFHVYVAAFSLVVVALSIIAIIIFQVLTLKEAELEAVPIVNEEINYSDVDIASNDEIDTRLSPPSVIRFVPLFSNITSTVTTSDVLGVFSANSFYELAEYPNDFVIIGGRDAAMFQRVAYNGSTGLSPSEPLALLINSALAEFGVQNTQEFELNLVAYDIFGNRSEPETVKFSIRYGKIDPAASAQYSPLSSNLSDHELVAAELSNIVDPDGTTRRFEVYQELMNFPKECDLALTGNPYFIAQFKAAFEQRREILTSSNYRPFLDGVCSAWKIELQDKQSRINEQIAERNAVINSNAIAQAQVASQKLFARTGRYGALMVGLAALSFFLMISLVLAFLAIEGHAHEIKLFITHNTGGKDE